MKGWVVQITTDTGEMIEEHAGTLAGALQGAWRKVFPEWDGNVQVDSNDPLCGILDGRCTLTKMFYEEGTLTTKAKEP